MSGCRLEARELTKSFGGVTAVDNVSFTAEAGSITGVVGPNGAGKTTLFNLLTGIYPADHGQLVVKESQHRDFHRGIGAGNADITDALGQACDRISHAITPGASTPGCSKNTWTSSQSRW